MVLKYIALCSAGLLSVSCSKQEGSRAVASSVHSSPAPASQQKVPAGERLRFFGVATPAATTSDLPGQMRLEAEARSRAMQMIGYAHGVSVELKAGNVALSNSSFSSAGMSVRAVERLSKGAVAAAIEAPVDAPAAGAAPLAAFTLRVPIWSDSEAKAFPIRFSRSISEQAKQELHRLGLERGRMLLRGMALEREGDSELIRADFVLLPAAAR
jgi:hypothetical protein